MPEEDVAFVFISWNSQRLVFMESALCAETIGHREVAPMLKGLKAKLPGTSLTLVGHSLGGRMMLATLQGPDRSSRPETSSRIASSVWRTSAAYRRRMCSFTGSGRGFR